MTWKMVKDGLTNTFMVGEVLPDWNYELSPAEDPNTVVVFAQRICADPAGHIRNNWPCWQGAGTITTLPPINFRTDEKASCQGSPITVEQQIHNYRNSQTAWGFKSRHPGGANFLFADGSVRFVPEDINHDLYQLLGCRDEGRYVEEIP